MMYLWHRFKKPELTIHVPDTNRKQPWWVILKYQLSCYCSLFVRLKRGHVSFTIKIIYTMATWENFHSFIFVEFNLGALFTNSLGAAFNTAFGRDCKGRAQGDYFYGCQVGDIVIRRRSFEFEFSSALDRLTLESARDQLKTNCS